MRGHQRPAVWADLSFWIYCNSDNLPWHLYSLLPFTETAGPQLLYQINLLWHLCVMQNSVEWLSAQQGGRSFQTVHIDLKTKATHAHSYIVKRRFAQALEVNFEIAFTQEQIPGSGIRVGIPGLLFNPQCCFGQDGAEPAGNVHANVIDLMGVLTRSTWSICVRLILKDLHTATFTATLFSALFL